MVWRQHSEKDNGIFIMIPWYFNLAPYIMGWYLFKNNSRVNTDDKNDDEVN